MGKILEFRLRTEGEEVAAKAFLSKLLEGQDGMKVSWADGLVQLELFKGEKGETVHERQVKLLD